MNDTVLLYKEKKMFVDSMNIPEYYGKPYIEINNNIPNFPEDERKGEFEPEYRKVGSYIRDDGVKDEFCSVYVCIKKSKSKGKRTGGKNRQVSNYYTCKYDFIRGKQLYNDCHLVAIRLPGGRVESKKNVIMGTRYFNEIGMLPFENKVAEYVKNTDGENYVLYRLTPVVDENHQLVKGVQMEALSVGDNGKLCFNVFVYNVQPGVDICYKNCKNEEDTNWASDIFTSNPVYPEEEGGLQEYTININTNRFHKPDCNCVADISPEHKKLFECPRQFLIDNGCKPCKVCIQ